MSIPEFSLLEQVDLRSVWPSEPQNFTRWLSMPQNLRLLSETLQLGLQYEDSEKYLGPYRADIICKDMNSGKLVVIENQLEESDHTHLGQSLVYAAGFQAQTTIWIAKQFTAQHRAAIDWLNSNMGPEINFFAVEVQLWKIGSSNPALKFEIVSQPNDWSNRVAEASREIKKRDLSEKKLRQYEYWTAFIDALKKSLKLIRPQRPQAQYWIEVPVGRAGMNLSGIVKDDFIAVELFLEGSEAKRRFHELFAQKDEIEREIGTPLEWQESSEKAACHILLCLQGTNFSEKSDWPRQHAWILDHLEIFQQAFGPRIRNLGLKEAS